MPWRVGKESPRRRFLYERLVHTLGSPCETGHGIWPVSHRDPVKKSQREHWEGFQSSLAPCGAAKCRVGRASTTAPLTAARGHAKALNGRRALYVRFGDDGVERDWEAPLSKSGVRSKCIPPPSFCEGARVRACACVLYFGIFLAPSARPQRMKATRRAEEPIIDRPLGLSEADPEGSRDGRAHFGSRSGANGDGH